MCVCVCGDESNEMEGGFREAVRMTLFLPACVMITGDRADGGGEINSLKSGEKCLIANKSAEHVYPAKHNSNQL